ncbi:MAG: hypothetical protein ACFFE8_13200 [Candidatus Heimdallarchaeota archaeon]
MRTGSEWSNRTYGGTTFDYAYSVIQTLDGGYLLVGSTESFGEGKMDLWLVKTDENGTAEWNHTYGGKYNEVGSSVIQMADGGYVLAGYTESGIEGNADGWLVRVNDNGEIVWDHTYGGPKLDIARSVVQAPDGGFALVGYTGSYGEGDDDMWLIKTDETGIVEWNQTFGGTMLDHGYSLVSTKDGGYALVGKTMSVGAGQSDMWLVKTNETGGIEWSHTYGGIGPEEAVAVVQTHDGGYTLAGSTYSFGLGSADLWMIRIDEKGLVQWNQTYGGEAKDNGYSMIKTHDQGYALAGRTWSFGMGQGDMWLVKIDENGSTEWNQTFGGFGYDAASKVIQTGDEDYILAGSTYSFGSGSSDMLLVTTGSFGTSSSDMSSVGTDVMDTPITSNITLYSGLIGFVALIVCLIERKRRNKS